MRIQFVRAELASCRAAVEMGEMELAAHNMPIAVKEVANAEKGIGVARRFLPGVAAQNRGELESSLAEVEKRLQMLKAKVSHR